MNSLFSDIAAKLAHQGLTVVSKDFDRPWGGFFVIDESRLKSLLIPTSTE
jgi:hypothetical protein